VKTRRITKGGIRETNGGVEKKKTKKNHVGPPRAAPTKVSAAAGGSAYSHASTVFVRLNAVRKVTNRQNGYGPKHHPRLNPQTDSRRDGSGVRSRTDLFSFLLAPSRFRSGPADAMRKAARQTFSEGGKHEENAFRPAPRLRGPAKKRHNRRVD